LRTGELAERAGVNVQTLRNYERRGLLATPTRRPSGQREYSEDAVRLLRTIKAAQRLGFTLAEIEELLDLSEHRRGSDELHRRAQAKVAEIDAKIDQLTRMRERLVAVVAAECDSLTDCSCGLGCPCPSWTLPAPAAAMATTTDPHRPPRSALAGRLAKRPSDALSTVCGRSCGLYP
jgi:MerR family transcriptional regulator, mercuric resistance operon regulatory protein